MNKDVFLNCLSYTGINTGISVMGLYSFSSGLSGACFNQLYSSGYNYFSGLPYEGALPLIYNGAGNQTSGIFSSNQSYHIPIKNFNSFGALISLNHSGCLNTGNTNLVLFSTVSDFSGINSGIVLGITPSNRLFLNASGYLSTISEEITPNDFVFVSLEEKRFVNFGIFNIKHNEFYKKSYDYNSSDLIIEKLYFGGVLKYPSIYTGYSGKLNEIYFFSGAIDDFLFNSCIDCTYATGYSYSQSIDIFNQVKITGSFWSGIKETRITGSKKTTGTFLKTDGSTGNFYYDSGLSGSVEVYQNLFPGTGIENLYITGSGIDFYFDSSKKISQTSFDLFFDLGLDSGDVLEIYTYKNFNPNVNLNIIDDFFPSTDNYVQLFANGLAETKDGESQYFSDFYTGFNNKIYNFDSQDILSCDFTTGNSITIPYNNQGCITGEATSSEVIDIYQINAYPFFPEVSSEEEIPPFIYDLYLNGKKLISGLDYIITGVPGGIDGWSNHIYLSGDNSLLFNLENPQEFKLVISQPNYVRNLFYITKDTHYLTGLSGFSEQIWKNGIRQKNKIDYYIKNSCNFYSGEYLDPNYSFQLLNSTNSFINDFTSLGNYVYRNAQQQIESLTQNSSVDTKKIFSNTDFINYETQTSLPSCVFSGSGVNKNLYVTNISSGTIKSGMFIYGANYQNQIITGFVQGTYGNTGLYSTNTSDNFSQKLLTGYSIPNFERNTGCWVYPLGKELTCISPWNSHNLFESNTRTCTLITPQHVLCATHFPPNSAGNTIVFVTEDNQIITRKVVDNSYVQNFMSDLLVILLDSPLPDSIKPCLLLPSNYLNYLNFKPIISNIQYSYKHTSPEVCGLFLDKQKQANIGAMEFGFKLDGVNIISNGTRTVRIIDSENELLKSFYEQVIVGDSGSPLFLIINGKLCLLTTFKDPGGGHLVGDYISYINSAIATLKIENPDWISTDYTVTEFDFSEFDKRNNYPFFYP
jgi:hypothetical protein